LFAVAPPRADPGYVADPDGARARGVLVPVLVPLERTVLECGELKPVGGESPI